jgi:hypothetical protein
MIDHSRHCAVLTMPARWNREAERVSGYTAQEMLQPGALARLYPGAPAVRPACVGRGH